MANLAYKKAVKTGNDYVNLEELMGITFSPNGKYQIQLCTSAWIIISDEKPTEGGFLIFDNRPFGYTHTGSKVWVKTIENRPLEINISEG